MYHIIIIRWYSIKTRLIARECIFHRVGHPCRGRDAINAWLSRSRFRLTDVSLIGGKNAIEIARIDLISIYKLLTCFKRKQRERVMRRCQVCRKEKNERKGGTKRERERERR